MARAADGWFLILCCFSFRQGSSRLLLHTKKLPDPKKVFQEFGIGSSVKKIAEIKDPDVQDRLLVLEEQEGAVHFKIGVLLARKGQMTDNEMFSNELPTPEFERFYSSLGDVVPQLGWTGFRGGLDVKGNRGGGGGGKGQGGVGGQQRTREKKGGKEMHAQFSHFRYCACPSTFCAAVQPAPRARIWCTPSSLARRLSFTCPPCFPFRATMRSRSVKSLFSLFFFFFFISILPVLTPSFLPLFFPIIHHHHQKKHT
jgi:hypothetical protein